jgi:hypothetical protein
MAWLALYGSEAEVAAGFLVNFAAWGANCGRMGRALRDRYGLTQETTAFFDLFAAAPTEFESQATATTRTEEGYSPWPPRSSTRKAVTPGRATNVTPLQLPRVGGREVDVSSRVPAVPPHPYTF